MRILSYLIITAVSLAIGISSLNSFEFINAKETIIFEDTFANLNLEDRYLLEPVFNLLLKDLNS